MIRIFREDTQWAIAGNVETAVIEDLARGLPRELQGSSGSKIVSGNEGFAALLVFGDLPSERLANQLLMSATPVYLLDFDDDAPVTLRLDRKKMRATETRLDVHPAGFLKQKGIIAPGHAAPIPVKNIGLVEGITMAEAEAGAREVIPGGEFEFHPHPRGVLVDDAPAAGSLARQLGKRAYLIFRNPEDGDFLCMVQEADQSVSSYSPQKPSPNFRPLDNVLGETTPAGILRALEIPGELIGL
jgi:hypothetical protein